jgi:hypothetical protein
MAPQAPGVFVSLAGEPMLALPRSLILTSYLYTQQVSTVVRLASDWR